MGTSTGPKHQLGMGQRESPESRAEQDQQLHSQLDLGLKEKLKNIWKLGLSLNYLGMAATAEGGGLRASWAPKPGLGGHSGHGGLAGRG